MQLWNIENCIRYQISWNLYIQWEKYRNESPSIEIRPAYTHIVAHFNLYMTYLKGYDSTAEIF